jgi:hypothetical protein
MESIIGFDPIPVSQKKWDKVGKNHPSPEEP